MKIFGVIAAMAEEMESLKEAMKIENVVKKPGLEFYVGKIFDGQKIVLVESGIGKVNAAATTQSLINLFDIDFIINIGVAGAINDFNIGDLIIAKDLVQHDFDLTAFNYDLGFIPRANKVFFECDKKMLDLIKKFDLDKKEIYFGRIASGDKFICSEQERDFIKNNFKADCVEMEGAAIAQVAFLNQIPFVVIRAISDNANKNAIEIYNQSLDLITQNYLKLISYIIKNY